MAVAVTTTPAFKAGLRDGQRFLINTMRDDVAPLAIHVVLDWRALLRGR